MGFILGFLCGMFFSVIVALGVAAAKEQLERNAAIDRIRTGLHVYQMTNRNVDVMRDPLMLVDLRETVN